MGFVEDSRFTKFGARCLFFDRFDGVSPKPFDSLNFSTTVGDSPDNVKENFKIAESLINAKIATLNQIHSDRIMEYDGKIHDADGLITDKTGIFLAIKFADCTPIMFMDIKNRVVAAVHAGWRGTYLQIASKMVKLFKEKGSKPEDILVSIGPHICNRCYEIKSDVAEKFNEEFVEEREGKLFLNLSKANTYQLLESGIPEENIKDLNICTSENKRFFSYRRDKICGRNLGGIVKVF